MFEWYTHLCNYYEVSPEEALELGTRSSGRKPSLPGSKTCQSVSEMTYEDIWALKNRDSINDVMSFYKDQGAWSAFRQVVRHKDMEQLHINYFNAAVQIGALCENAHICEYGGGVAPFVTTLLKYVDPKSSFKVTVTDVDCEHLNFAKYRLNDIKEMRGLANVELDFQTVTPDSLPDFTRDKLDVVLCFEVLEHVPSPLAAVKNIVDNTSSTGIYVENFIKHEPHDDEEDDGPDLVSARNERDLYYDYLRSNMQMVSPTIEESEKNPNVTRIWKK